jgi:hypothetical protein
MTGKLTGGSRSMESQSERRGRFYTCPRHGWDALGSPGPDCRDGDAPRHCAKHGWSHRNKGCPECTAGR